MGSAGKYSFIIEQGSTFSLELQYLDGNNNPIDLTGFGGEMQIRPAINCAPYITLSSSLQADGQQGVYDLKITSGSFASRILEGKVQLSLEVSR